MAELNDKQMAFCREYIIDMNKSQAAIRAGYSKKTAGAIGSRLLKNVKVERMIEQLKKERAERTEITADRVVEELAKIGFMNIKDVLEWGTEEKDVWTGEMDESGNPIKVTESFDYVRLKDRDNVDGALISSVKMTKHGMAVEMHDKMRALEMLAKHTGVYDDRPQTHVDVGDYVRALYERANKGDIWEGHTDDDPDGDDDGED